MTPTHFGPNGPRPTLCATPASSRGAAVTELEARLAALVRGTVAIEAALTEILLRLDWLERDVAALTKRGQP